METVRVLLVDDTRIVREAVAELLSEARSFDLVGQADDARTAVQMAVKYQPDIVLLGLSTAEEIDRASRQITLLAPRVRIIAFTLYDGELVAELRRTVGGAIYAMKICDLDALLPAIRTVVARERCAPIRLAAERRPRRAGGRSEAEMAVP